jgi:protein-tyrosine phosphatase
LFFYEFIHFLVLGYLFSKRFKNEKSIDFIKIPIEDSPNESIETYLEDVCNFLDTNIKNRKQPCLVYSNLGISRSAAFVLAYFVYSERLTVEVIFLLI